MGSKFDAFPPHCIATYMSQVLGLAVHVSQPEQWLARQAVSQEQLRDDELRKCIRYQTAFEKSDSQYLFLMHNDVFILKDIVGALKNEIGDSFAIGEVGQCWNCPAANAEIAGEVMGCGPCSPQKMQDFRPDFPQLQALYARAREKGSFVRPYDADNFSEEFARQPWPLPECRINEWACLINLKMVRRHCAPYGSAYPPGAYRLCSGHNLDVLTPFMRDLYAQGLRARHFDVRPYLRHWVGTGHKSAVRYTQSEDQARRLLQKHFAGYVAWLEKEGRQHAVRGICT